MKIKQLESSRQTDKDYKKRYDLFYEHFKNNMGYIQFPKYYVVIRKNSDWLRWFHNNKYIVEVVVNGDNYIDNRTHQNIAPFVLFSSYSDAILHLVLTENKALRIIEEKAKLKEEGLNNDN